MQVMHDHFKCIEPFHDANVIEVAYLQTRSIARLKQNCFASCTNRKATLLIALLTLNK